MCYYIVGEIENCIAMYIKKLAAIILTIFTVCLPVYSIEEINKGDVLDINQCIEIALKNSPYIAQAKNRVRIAKTGLGKAKADWTPFIGAGIGYDGSTSKSRKEGTEHENRFGINAQISQLIYDFGKTSANISSHKFALVASEFELDYTILETEHAVKTAYYTVLAAKANVDVAVENLEINERTYDQIKSYYDEGIRSRIDFVNADVNLSNAKVTYLEAQDKYHDAMISLNKALYMTDIPTYSIKQFEKFNITNDQSPVAVIHGHDGEHDHDTSHNHDELQNQKTGEISLTGIVKEQEIVKGHSVDKFDKSFEEILQIATENRPDLKSYTALKNAAEESLKATKRSWYPELSANAGYNYSKNRHDGINTLSYGAELSIPILSPIKVKYEIDSSKAELDNANQDLKLIYQDIYYDVQLALCETKIHENKIPLVLEKIRLAKEEFELAEGRYLEGIGNYIELQDSRSKYLNAQHEYINTVYDYSLARAELDFAMGVR